MWSSGLLESWSFGKSGVLEIWSSGDTDFDNLEMCTSELTEVGVVWGVSIYIDACYGMIWYVMLCYVV